MNVLSSSLRERSLDTTLYYALKKAVDLNITRITDTSLLDKIGIPVFASIRPRGNSLCVNAGKGFTVKEAKIGALMEAIEYAYAEYSYANKTLEIVTIAEFIAQLPTSVKIEDFAILYDRRAQTDELIACIECLHFFDKKPYLLPAQLVFIPFRENPAVNLFGTSTNGLASGNSLKEAMVHAICELLERDATSFNLVKDSTIWVDVEHSTSQIIQMKNQIESTGLEFALRYSINSFGFPYFEAYIVDVFDSDFTSISGGYGLHPVKEIAAIRAIAEAVQSRLTTIHGGRDDIIGNYESFERFSNARKFEVYSKRKAEILNRQRTIRFDEVTESFHFDNIDEVLDLMISRLKINGMEDIFYYVFTEAEDELQVVKVVIPKLERFDEKLKRIGPRLLSYILNNES